MREAAFTRAGAGRPLSSALREATQGEPSTIVFTSGSSGTPRAVLHSVAAHRAAAEGAAAVMPFGPGDRWLVSLPLCHVGGLALVFRALQAGGALAVPAPGQSLTDAVEQLAPTHLSLVAPQLRDLLASPVARAGLSKATVVLVGGGPTPRELFEAALDAGIPVRQTWGLTETGGQVCTSEAGRPETCGLPLPGRQVHASDAGELRVSGAGLLTGFVEGDVLVDPFDADGLYATGDLGRREPEGWVIVGRKDFRFISGGENIQPEEVATALGDARTGVMIVPVADDRFGQRPFCFFEGEAEDTLLVAGLRTRAEERLPRFMHPVGYARLPATTGTKHRRADLVALAERIHTGGGPTSSHATPAPSPAGGTDGL
jgi:O-succinylbenzoic acid--CoA ligase